MLDTREHIFDRPWVSEARGALLWFFRLRGRSTYDMAYGFEDQQKTRPANRLEYEDVGVPVFDY